MMPMIRAILRNAGISTRGLSNAIRGWRRHVLNKRKFLAMQDARMMPWGNDLPMLTEWCESCGSFGAYFLQDQLVARWIYENQPRRHVDVGSRIDGFIGSLSVFREVEVIDIRPQPRTVRNVRFHRMDLMDDLPDEWLGYTDSLSCLHTIEHFGLGRYGDPIDPGGHLKGLVRLKSMVEPGGMIYLSTPIGSERIEFDAHRVFSPSTLASWFADGWTIEKFAVINDQQELDEHPSWEEHGIKGDYGCRLGVGIIAARKTP